MYIVYECVLCTVHSTGENDENLQMSGGKMQSVHMKIESAINKVEKNYFHQQKKYWKIGSAFDRETIS